MSYSASTIKTALERLHRPNTAPWLCQPIYHRFLAAIQPTTTQSSTIILDPQQLALRKYVYEGANLEGDNTCVGTALAYWNSETIRSYLNALFFGGASSEQIAEVTLLPLECVDAYKRLFCDIEVLGGAPILMLDYIQKMPEITPQDTIEKNMYKMSLEYGWEWVVWKLTNGLQGHLSVGKVIDTMTTLAFWRSLEAAASPLGSKKAQEGKQYMKMAAEFALGRHSAKLGELNSVKDLVLKLTAVTPTEYRSLQEDTLPEINDLLYASEDKGK